jgi:hypothetical protein
VTPYTMILPSLKASLGCRLTMVMGPQMRSARVDDPAGRQEHLGRRSVVGGP